MGIAMEWLYTGRKVSLEEASRWGLVNRVAPTAKLMDTAMELAAEIVASAPLSLQRMKLTYRKTLGMPLLSALRLDVGPDLPRRGHRRTPRRPLGGNGNRLRDRSGALRDRALEAGEPPALTIREMPALEEDRKRLASQLQLPALTIPPEQQLPDLLDRITRAARVSEVRLLGLKPQADLRNLKPGPSGYIEVPLEVIAAAGYHSIGRFLDGLESSQDLLQVRELQIESNSRDVWSHAVTVLLVAYLVPASAAS